MMDPELPTNKQEITKAYAYVDADAIVAIAICIPCYVYRLS